VKFKTIIPFFLFFLNCSVLFYRVPSIEPVEFDYKSVSKSYFSPNNELPFPLTVRRSNNINNSITKDGRYLYFSSDTEGNFNLYVRDLNSSIVMPITQFPSSETKPAISPDGKKLAYVSERYDSDGDIVIMEIEVEKWIRKYLKGSVFTDSIDYFVLTNPNYSDKSKIIRAIDTDPSWSPDSRYLVYVSDINSPGTTNIMLVDIKNNYKTIQLTKDGAVSPTFSPDGKSIYYISYKDHKYGEIYSLDVLTGKENRVTNDEYFDLSPSISDDGKYLIYTSIRNDTNKNGSLGARDNGIIIRKDLKTGKVIELTAGNFPLFDTKYSNFIDGSIIFTASLENAHNIYFIPLDGEIPKMDSIHEQYRKADNYRERSVDFSKLAFKSIDLFYGEDKLYPLFKSRYDRQIVKDLEASSRDNEAKAILNEMLTKKGDPQFGFSYALSFAHSFRKNGLNPIPTLISYYEEMKNQENIHQDILPSILHWTGEMYEEMGRLDNALELYQKIVDEFPNFYRILEVKKSIGHIRFTLDGTKIPNEYIEIYGNDELDREDLVYIYKEIIRFFQKIEDPDKRMNKAREMIEVQNLKEMNVELYGLISFIIAEQLNSQDKFQESIDLINSYSHLLNKVSFEYLKSMNLLYDNYHDLEDPENSKKALLEFIKHYDYKTGITVNESDFENTLQYFETKAILEENQNNLLGSIQNIERNNLLFSVSVEKQIPLKNLYGKYSNYYQKKFVDTSMKFSLEEDESLLSNIVDEVNILNNERVDLIGRSTYTLSYIFSYDIFRIFGDFRDLDYEKVYNEDSFEIIDKFYNERLIKAREFLDYSTIFGYSYYLVSKATHRESVYLKKNLLTSSRKSKILQDLKEAEYNLYWIIFAKPDYADAYLLLGWLHQYIDIRKLDTIYPEQKKDFEVFESLYEKYFPKKYFEENIELYTQILEFIDSTENKKLLSDLNLNLANTFFLLNNYQNALKHYEKVEEYSQSIIPKIQFDSYQQNGMYLFNIARANVYNGNLEKSIPYLTKVKDIYYDNEYYPLISKIGINKEAKKEIEDLESTKRKLTLIHALIAMAQLESEKYDDAILSFSNALSMNGNSNYINDINLYNSLAICYQKIGAYDKSEKALRLADLDYKENKIRLKKLFTFSFWDTVFPTDLRVIGDGRFPTELPLDFSNIITTGIKIQNNIEKHEFDIVYNLYKKRDSFIIENKLNETKKGKEILEATFSQIAYSEYLRGDYFKSAEYYHKDYDQKFKQKRYDEALDAYLRSDISLFAHIEEESDKPETILNELNENTNFLENFKKVKIDKCLSEIDKDNLDIQRCEDIFINSFPEYSISLVYNYFYKGELNSHVKNYEEAFSYYGRLIPLALNPGNIPDSEIGLPGDPYSMKYRIQLKIIAAVTYLRLGNFSKFKEIINEAYYKANEFNYEKELLRIYLIQSEFAYVDAKSDKDYKEGLDFIVRAENLLKTSPGIWFFIDEIYLNYLYTMKNVLFIKLKDYKSLSANNQKMYSAIFFKQLLVNELHFQDYKLFDALNDFQITMHEDKELVEKLEFSNSKFLDTKNILNLREANLKKLHSNKERLKSLIPKEMDIFSWMEKENFVKKPKLKSNEKLFEFFSNGEEYLQVSYHRDKIDIKKFILTNGYKLNEIGDGIVKELNNSEITDLIIIPSTSMYKFNFSEIEFKEKKLSDHFKIRYLFHLNQLKREEKFEYSRLGRITSIEQDNEKLIRNDKYKDLKRLNLRIVNSEELPSYLMDTDVLEGPTDFDNRKLYIGEKKDGYLSIRDIAENQWNLPLIVLNNYKKSLDNYLKSGFIYDLLLFAGVQSIVLIDEGKDSDRIRDRILMNINDINNIIREEKLLLVGEIIEPVPNNPNLVKKEIEKYTKISIEEERIGNYFEAMKNLLWANSLLVNTNQLKLESELNLDRLKLKLFPDLNYLNLIESLLKKFPENSIEQEQILFNMLTNYLEFDKEFSLEMYYDKYLTNTNSTDDRKFLVKYYRALKNGEISFILKEKIKFDKLNSNIDPFLYSKKMSIAFSSQTLWEDSLEYIDIAIKNSKNEQEKKIANEVKTDILYEIYYMNGIDIEEETNNKILSLAKNRLWEKYNSKIDDEFKIESDYYKKYFQVKIYKAFDLLENSSSFKPISLSPLILKDGSPSLSLLREVDRVFLFYLLEKSIPFQIGSELNNQFDLLKKSELELKNNNRVYWMQIQWASYLFHRGDYISSLKYFKDFEDNYKNVGDHLNLYKHYLLLKYKLSKRYNEIKFDENEKNSIRRLFSEWYNYYEKIENSEKSEDYYTIINRITKDKKNQLLDDFSKNEFIDILEFSMFETLEKNKLEDFFNIAYYKDNIKNLTFKVLNRTPRFSDLQPLKNYLHSKIREKLPQGQALKALFDLGIETYLVDIEDGKSSKKLFSKDNRILKNQIFEYLNSIKDYGKGIVQQKTIETNYRKELNLKPNQLTYLYFPSYHFKVSLEPKEIDYFYFANSLESLAERNPEKYHKNWKNNSNIQYIQLGSKKSEKIINDLIAMEINLISNKTSKQKIVISSEELNLIDGRTLQFNNKPIYTLSNSVNKINLPWVYYGARLDQSSIKNDDFLSSLNYLDNYFIGPGLIYTGSKNDIHLAYFTKELLRKSANESMFERYTDAFLKLKIRFPEDRFWNSLKPYTNTLIVD
jgi:tetratricopeptide (TPR) repeat protein